MFVKKILSAKRVVLLSTHSGAKGGGRERRERDLSSCQTVVHNISVVRGVSCKRCTNDQ
jgi:hypothetical protein